MNILPSGYVRYQAVRGLEATKKDSIRYGVFDKMPEVVSVTCSDDQIRDVRGPIPEDLVTGFHEEGSHSEKQETAFWDLFTQEFHGEMESSYLTSRIFKDEGMLWWKPERSSSVATPLTTSVPFLSGVFFHEVKKIEPLVQDCKDRIGRLMKSWNNDSEEEVLDYEDNTVERAGHFLRDLAMSRNNIISDILEVDMSPASRNSIDLWWDHEKFELLINFRPDGSGSYHGDDRQGATIADPNRVPRIKSIGCWMEDLLCS